MFRDDLELERELIGKSLGETHLEFGDPGGFEQRDPVLHRNGNASSRHDLEPGWNGAGLETGQVERIDLPSTRGELPGELRSGHQRESDQDGLSFQGTTSSRSMYRSTWSSRTVLPGVWGSARIAMIPTPDPLRLSRLVAV